MFIDGTFKIVPVVYREFRSSSQVYTFNVFFGDKIFPLLFALLPGKTMDIYVELLRILQNLRAELGSEQDLPLKWVTIHLDFEQAAREAFLHIHRDVTLRGCYFHFCQAIYRHINEDSTLRYLFKNGHYEFNLATRRLMALAFVPHDAVRWAYQKIVADFQRFHPFLWNNYLNVQQVCMLSTLVVIRLR